MYIEYVPCTLVLEWLLVSSICGDISLCISKTKVSYLTFYFEVCLQTPLICFSFLFLKNAFDIAPVNNDNLYFFSRSFSLNDYLVSIICFH